MDQQTIIIIAALAGIAGIFASLAILRRYRVPKESPFAVSTEGEKRCPNCGMGNRAGRPLRCQRRRMPGQSSTGAAAPLLQDRAGGVPADRPDTREEPGDVNRPDSGHRHSRRRPRGRP
jgi:hypothetical protein